MEAAGGTGWEIFTFRHEGAAVLGSALDTGEWGYSEIAAVGPCRIESDAIHWIYLNPEGGYPI